MYLTPTYSASTPKRHVEEVHRQVLLGPRADVAADEDAAPTYHDGPHECSALASQPARAEHWFRKTVSAAAGDMYIGHPIATKYQFMVLDSEFSQVRAVLDILMLSVTYLPASVWNPPANLNALSARPAAYTEDDTCPTPAIIPPKAPTVEKIQPTQMHHRK